MSSIPHRALIVQSNGIVAVSDGSDQVVFDSFADFVAASPGFALPEGAVALNYEVRGARVMHLVTGPQGQVVNAGPDPEEAYEDVIDDMPALLTARATLDDPYRNVVTVLDAQTIAHGLVSAEFETRAAPLVDGKWGLNERDTFHKQLAEAQAWTADPLTLTPLLDAIIAHSGEAKAELAAAIIANSAALEAAVGALLGKKRVHLDAIYALLTVEDVKAYDVTAGW